MKKQGFMMKNKEFFQKELKKEILKTVKESLAGEKRIGVAFSGGLDSSLLARACQLFRKDVTLLTCGFFESHDIDLAKKVSRFLNLPLEIKILNRKDFERDIKEVIKLVNIEQVVNLEICLSFYYVYKLALEQGIKTVAFASGLDALFCGFDKYREILRKKGRIGVQRAIKREVKLSLGHEKNYYKLAQYFQIKRVVPFLRSNFIKFACLVPISLKIESSNDMIRKHILRLAAQGIGLPKISFSDSKKSVQYGTKIDYYFEKLAKKKGINRNKARLKRFLGIKEAYLRKLQGNIAS